MRIIPAFVKGAALPQDGLKSVCIQQGMQILSARGHVLRKEVMSMKQFLLDVLATFIATVLAALAIRFLNL